MSVRRSASQNVLDFSSASVTAATPFETTQFGMVTATIRLTTTVDAASALGSMRFRNGNVQPPTTGTLPFSTVNPVLLSTPPTGATFTGGILTFSTGYLAGTNSIQIGWTLFGQFFIPDWSFTAGGGTVTGSVWMAGWSV